MAVNPSPLAYTSFTIGDTPGTMFDLADTGMPTELPSISLSFMGRLEKAPVRSRSDADPSREEGRLHEISEPVYLSKREMEILKWVGTTGTKGVVKGHFYDVNVSELVNITSDDGAIYGADGNAATVRGGALSVSSFEILAVLEDLRDVGERTQQQLGQINNGNNLAPGERFEE